MADRTTICFPRWGSHDVTKPGDDDFSKELDRWYSAEESKALEALIQLKARLRTLPTEDFWAAAVEGLSQMVGSEFGFVMKRMLVDDHNTAVEMPPIGEPGSCLMAAAIHYTTSSGDRHTVKQNKFHAYACPCAYMRHDKIFVIPEDLSGFITNNPNQLPISADAYMAVPIFAEGKCIAHFGVMWTKESSPKRRLSWAFVETLLHALEDMIQQRLLEGVAILDSQSKPIDPIPQRIIPHEAISVAQSLRPYAGSLSHELRTPMQGVVGMLDVMYATVQEAVQSQDDPHLKTVFQNLKESIEVVQDSSRRAVVAADNVVHAYDMNMRTPESISPLHQIPEPFASAKQPDIIVAGQEIPLARSTLKRRREADLPQRTDGSPSKWTKFEAAASAWANGTEPSREIREGLQEAENVHLEDQDLRQAAPNGPRLTPDMNGPRHSPSLQPSRIVRRAANIRAVLQYVITEGLKTGGRPDFVTAEAFDDGEMIEVRTRGSDGTFSQKHIRWSVDKALPKTLNYDEKDFSKLVSCLVLNAIKFTDGTDAKIGVQARLGHHGRFLSISISDNGPGIPVNFLPELFKPFSQENGSITRQSEGLGLGLMVAKGIARKLGGDVMCAHTSTDAKDHGCVFEIRLPIKPAMNGTGRSPSPSGSPRTNKQGQDAYHLSLEPKQQTVDEPAELRRDSSDLARADVASKLNLIDSMANGQAPSSHRPSLAKLHRSNGLMRSASQFEIDRDLANKYPLTFLVAEDNKINRRLLVSMLSKFGYRQVLEAHDGAEAVRQMSSADHVDVILMDLWMPTMDGYEATQRILSMERKGINHVPTVLAVTADVTDGALKRAAAVGMKGFMTKPYKLQDLQRLITEYCVGRATIDDNNAVDDTPTVLQRRALTA